MGGYELNRLRITQKPLIKRVKESLIRFIKYNNLEGSILPSESVLHKAIGVSRTTLRSAMILLEMDGIVFKKHGVGTYVSKHALKPRIRLNEAPEFSSLIQDFGYKSEIRFLYHEIRSDMDEINTKLGRNVGMNILSVHKQFLADRKPAIYCIDYLPFDIIKGDFLETDLHEPIFNFLREKCGEEVIYNITQIIPMIAHEKLAEHIGVSDGAPIIMFSEVGFNNSDKAIIYSDEYYRPDLIEMNIVRRKV